MTTSVDYDVSNYSLEEMYELIGLNMEDELTSDIITIEADLLIKKYNEENNESLKNFFINVKKILLDDIYVSNNEETLIISEENPGNDITLQNVKKNPKFDNVIKRMVNIDSAYRLNTFPLKDDDVRYSDITDVETTIYSNTDFTCNLTDKLNNVLSLTLHSVQIPYSWYNINRYNNTFKIESNEITIEPGNYTVDELVTTINLDLSNNDLGEITYNKSSYKINIELTSQMEITFYSTETFFVNSKSNYNLGWLLGFRNSIYNSTTITGEAIANLNGPKYFNIVLDEFKSNLANKGIVSIETSENKLSLPSYFSNDLYLADTPELNRREIPQYSNIRQINDTFFPKNITKAQETTINEIIKSRNETTKTKLKIPNNENVFAFIPFQKPTEYGDIICIEGTLETNSRVYLGPINIEKLRIRLVDDVGNTVDLNGLDWCFSFIVEQSY